ncbi:periplasmic chaperone for outer membrane proteins Skp [Flavobacterium omnivorum]|uniref:Periplasmic chaperone for outer membrane proteins Skp n=1 Tax=Flavobacterium omnivorum TaxID=178355 RepID=A0A1G7W450_9FLAO|nr:OmpH family outer membrane protein [Flavobacterium omnivorum]SDG66688.1 periplasmic chaperone for outer membrane proteins Skp [Flavobacterium omnivorum]
MTKQFLCLFLAFITVQTMEGQARGNKLGYIDMEYILQNVPDYTEAKIQLEQKAQKWKLEIDTKKIEINKLKEALKAEKALLTKELIDERETEISFLENENLEYQQKRFGANGDLILQKSILVKPIQDQVFTAVQDIAERLKYDFIFDKASDLTMLFAAKRFDISEQVLRILNRTEKREQLTKKQQKEAEARELKEDALDSNPALADRQKLLEEKKAAREKVLEDRKLLQEQKKKEYDDKRKQIQDDREAKKNGTVSANITKEGSTATPTGVDTTKEAADQATQKQADAKAKLLENRKKIFEDRKKALEERRQKILEDREALKKAKQEKLKENTNNN